MRSSETEGSPISSFATRDWLDLRIFANSTCVNLCSVRNFLNCCLVLILILSLSAYISETKNIRKNKPEGTGE